MTGSGLAYLDWAATSIPDPDILDYRGRMDRDFPANPSSMHVAGREARTTLEEARNAFMGALGVRTGALAFTGTGSEADSLPLLSLVRRPGILRESVSRHMHLVVSAIEHPAVHEQAKMLEFLGLRVTYVPPSRDGIVDPRAMSESITKETALVCVMAVNNETGAIQPVGEIAAAIRERSAKSGGRRIPIHVDAIQALGKIPFRPDEPDVDSAAFSAHKIGGPKGVGAFWYRNDLRTLVVGGGQERGIRPGTENLGGAAAFAMAVRKCIPDVAGRFARASALEARLFGGLAGIGACQVLPHGRRIRDPRFSPYIVCVSFPGIPGEVMQRALSDAGIAVSTGSACSSGSASKRRRVLEAMGTDPAEALSAIRVSFGPTTEEADVDLFLDRAATLAGRLRAGAGHA